MTFIYQRCQRNFAKVFTIFGENYTSEVVTTYQEERCPEDEIGGGDDHVHLDPRDPLRLQVLDVALDLDALRRRDGQQVLAVLTHNITHSSSSLPKIWNFFYTGFSQSKI